MDVVDQLAAFVVDDLDSFIADFEAGESATRRKLRRQASEASSADSDDGLEAEEAAARRAGAVMEDMGALWAGQRAPDGARAGKGVPAQAVPGGGADPEGEGREPQDGRTERGQVGTAPPARPLARPAAAGGHGAAGPSAAAPAAKKVKSSEKKTKMAAGGALDAPGGRGGDEAERSGGPSAQAALSGAEAAPPLPPPEQPPPRGGRPDSGLAARPPTGARGSASAGAIAGVREWDSSLPDFMEQPDAPEIQGEHYLNARYFGLSQLPLSTVSFRVTHLLVSYLRPDVPSYRIEASVARAFEQEGLKIISWDPDHVAGGAFGAAAQPPHLHPEWHIADAQVCLDIPSKMRVLLVRFVLALPLPPGLGPARNRRTKAVCAALRGALRSSGCTLSAMASAAFVAAGATAPSQESGEAPASQDAARAARGAAQSGAGERTKRSGEGGGRTEGEMKKNENRKGAQVPPGGGARGRVPLAGCALGGGGALRLDAHYCGLLWRFCRARLREALAKSIRSMEATVRHAEANAVTVAELLLPSFKRYGTPTPPGVETPQKAKETPQKAKEAPQTAEETPQTAEETPQSAKETPQTAKETPQTAKETPQIAKETPQTAKESAGSASPVASPASAAGAPRAAHEAASGHALTAQDFLLPVPEAAVLGATPWVDAGDPEGGASFPPAPGRAPSRAQAALVSSGWLQSAAQALWQSLEERCDDKMMRVIAAAHDSFVRRMTSARHRSAALLRALSSSDAARAHADTRAMHRLLRRFAAGGAAAAPEGDMRRAAAVADLQEAAVFWTPVLVGATSPGTLYLTSSSAVVVQRIPGISLHVAVVPLPMIKAARVQTAAAGMLKGAELRWQPLPPPPPLSSEGDAVRSEIEAITDAFGGVATAARDKGGEGTASPPHTTSGGRVVRRVAAPFVAPAEPERSLLVVPTAARAEDLVVLLDFAAEALRQQPPAMDAKASDKSIEEILEEAAVA